MELFNEVWMQKLLKPTIVEVDKVDWNDYPHFKVDYEKGRFYCHCGKDHPSYIDLDLLKVLEQIRQKIGIPMIINSAFRCPEYNLEVGGKPLSIHQIGRAVDILAKNGRWRYPIVKGALECGIKRLGVAKFFVHIDNVQPNESIYHVSPALWIY